MKKLEEKFTFLVTKFHSRNGRLILLALVIALFVLSAGAPNATIGIGK